MVAVVGCGGAAVVVVSAVVVSDVVAPVLVDAVVAEGALSDDERDGRARRELRARRRRLGEHGRPAAACSPSA